MRTPSLDIARILALFDVGAPAGDIPEAKLIEEGFVRYDTIPDLYSDPSWPRFLSVRECPD